VVKSPDLSTAIPFLVHVKVDSAHQASKRQERSTGACEINQSIFVSVGASRQISSQSCHTGG
jgi:hypothetical protein